MKKRMQKILSLMLCAGMVLSLAACGDDANQANKTSEAEKSSESAKTDEAASSEDPQVEEEEREVVTLTFVSEQAISFTDVPQYFRDFMMDEFAVEVEFVANDENGIRGMMAAGELPDISIVTGLGNEVIAAESLVIDLNEYRDQLPNIFEGEMSLFYMSTVNNAIENYGKLSFLPIDCGSAVKNVGLPYLRFDLYEDLGMPEIKTEDDLLNVLKQMQELEPETDDGLPVYAMAHWTDWGFYADIWYYHFLHGTCRTGAMTCKVDGSECNYLLAEDGDFKKALKFLYKANQMGLVDPDSPSMLYQQYTEKVLSNRLLLWGVDWWQTDDQWNVDGEGNPRAEEDYRGYETVPMDFAKITLSQSPYAPVATGYGIAISSACENIDRALEVVNWMYSEEAAYFYWSGVEGGLWEYTDESKQELRLTDARITGDAGSMQLGNGGTIINMYFLFNSWPVSASAIMPSGHMAQIHEDKLLLKEGKERCGIVEDRVSYLKEHYKAAYGVEESKDLYKAGHDYTISTIHNSAYGKVMPDDIFNTKGIMQPLIDAAAWKMICAADEEEFEALWDQLLTDAETLDYYAVYEWQKDEFERSVARAYEDLK